MRIRTLISTMSRKLFHSFIPLACAECDDFLPFSGASSIPLCYIPLPCTLFHQLVFHPPSLHLAIYCLVYLSALLFPNSYIIHFLGDFYFLPFSVRVQTNIICLTCVAVRTFRMSRAKNKYICQLFTQQTQCVKRFCNGN